MTHNIHDVVIAGAGPVGLLLACELAQAGRSVLVLERDREPDPVLKNAPLGMRGLSAASVAAIGRHGSLPSAVPSRGAGHFAGITISPREVRPGLMTDLHAIETLLSERARELGVRVRRGAEVTALTQHDDHAVAHTAGQEHRGRWLVGCDGGRSTIRRLAGFTFTGTDPQFTGYAMLAAVAEPHRLNPGFTLTPTGMYLRTGAPDYVGVVDFDGGAFDRTTRPGRDHLQAVLRRVSGTEVSLEAVHHVTTFTDRAMQATTYRRGRVLLAGDAAHIHSPLGAQGLNLGIGDALALAQALDGDDPDGYSRERHPVGARVLDWARAQTAVMRPDPHSQAIQAVVRDLLSTPDGADYAYARIA